MKKQIAHELVSIAKRLLDLAATLERTEEPEPPAEPPASPVCTKCGLPIVEGVRPVRGAHYHCYRQLIRLIKDGLITEEEVVQSGKLLPALPGGRNPSVAKMDYVASLKEGARQLAETVRELAQTKAKPE
jgi:hypothetical protein